MISFCKQPFNSFVSANSLRYNDGLNVTDRVRLRETNCMIGEPWRLVAGRRPETHGVRVNTLLSVNIGGWNETV